MSFSEEKNKIQPESLGVTLVKADCFCLCSFTMTSLQPWKKINILVGRGWESRYLNEHQGLLVLETDAACKK